MARLAVRSSVRLMIERAVRPIAGVVTVRALPIKVVGRACVAGLAIGSSGSLVIESAVFPGPGVMTIRALTSKVVGGSRMA